MLGIKVSNVSYCYHKATILRNVSLSITPNQIICLAGPNGSGKSTLLHLLAGLTKPTCGNITINGIDLHTITKKELAKQIAFLPQQSRIPHTLTVREYVALGRYCYQSWLSGLSQSDYDAIDNALQLTDLVAKADHEAAALSLGQQQRARIALTLAQSTQYILLDEPMTGLDLKQQHNMMQLLLTLKALGKTIIVILHDLHQLKDIADSVILLKDGYIMGHGSPKQTLSTEMICNVFDCHCDLVLSRKGSISTTTGSQLAHALYN